ncbi:MAG TPA: glutamine-hydrolyzing carbamoyl-phosphate synthase small subunit [Gaiellales bacterium]|nr:glutamine-hydrolyzing carbamoyl-phosphate synthase small subunit [Gaiellales bacterium]
MTAMLMMEDGTVFRGRPYGAHGVAVGELVFTTSMTGYQEVVTDPSFDGQLITFTQPMIGNYGVEPDVSESAAPHARGVVVREGRNSTPLGREGFSEWLARHGVVGLQGVDTRAITRLLRDRGSMRAAVSTATLPPERVLELVREAPEMAGQALAGEVSLQRPHVLPAAGVERCHLALLDYGVKSSIVRLLQEAGARVTVLPWNSPAAAVLAVDPDGVLLANGPGDPAALPACVEAVRDLVGVRPLFGICLGHQLLGQALGLPTYKLRFGHRGANHPVLELDTGRVMVTAQNHGFAVRGPEQGRAFDSDFGPGTVTHVSLYDGTVEGLRLDRVRVSSLQFHPEASPGPHDARAALADFVESVAPHRGGSTVA